MLCMGALSAPAAVMQCTHAVTAPMHNIPDILEPWWHQGSRVHPQHLHT